MMTVDDLGGRGVSQMMTRGEKIDFYVVTEVK